MAKIINLDFETRSACELKKAGAWRYSRDDSTEVLCFAYRIDGGPIKVWSPFFQDFEEKPGRIPDDLRDAIGEGATIRAWNSFFEFSIWNNVLTEFPGFMKLPLNRFVDTAAKSAALALPRNLEEGAKALGLPIEKDMTGRRLMLKMSKPRKAKKDEKKKILEKGDTIALDDGGFLNEHYDQKFYLWHEDPQDFIRLFEYCKKDVEVESAVALRIEQLPWSDSERNLWLFDQRINLRGVPVDIEMVGKALGFLSHYFKELLGELKELTNGEVTTANQRARILSWLEGRGIVLEGLTKDHVDAALKDDSIDETSKRVLEIRKLLGKTSTKKLESMLACVDQADGRVRGTLLYHGASTGRWSGRLIQPQNFPRGSLKEDEVALAFERLNRGGYKNFREHYPDLLDAISSMLRGFIKAKKGKEFVAADFSSIESRALFWLANEEAGLKVYRTHGKIYEDMAATIYNKRIDEIGKGSFERQLGKQAVLGCFGPETLVFTNKGLKRIVDITTKDKVFDGKNFVEHEGVICQGFKMTINLFGVRVTPDHLIKTREKWESAFRVLRESSTLQKSALEKGFSAWKVMILDQGEELGKYSSLVLVTALLFMELTRITFEKVGRGLATFAQKTEARLKRSFIGAMRILSKTTNKGSVFSTVSRPRFNDAITQKVPRSNGMVEEESRFSQNGAKTDGSSLNISSRLTDGTTRVSKWTESTLIKTMSRGISVFVLVKRIWKTGEILLPFKTRFKDLKKRTKISMNVYDVVNAGENHRFLILTDEGPLLVHNCGYGMGGPKFQMTCEGYGMDVSKDLAKFTVGAFRSKFPAVVQYWRDLENAAVLAVKNPGKPYKVNNVAFKMAKGFLWARLPSGRLLAYYKPRLKMKETPWGEMKAVVTYMGLNSQTRKWERQSTYGGKLCENITQAVARDLMADAMVRLEAAGYSVIMTVHDEVVSEVPEGFGTVDEFELILNTTPTWARGLPVESEGWRGRRFKK